MMHDNAIPASCGSLEPQDTNIPSVFWLMANASSDVLVLEKKLGCKLTSTTLHCGCSRRNFGMEHVGKFLEEEYACGIFEKLILVGRLEDIQRLRDALPKAVQALVVGEMIQS